ncbi:MAG: PadR family transcriptional regulator [Actinobacteria bacterium]|nr:PadR family transcriptional regulator [Actinomycetota bacterium]
MENDTQIVKGILEGCILKITKNEEIYGYKAVEKLNTLGFEVNEATVYPILTRLQNGASFQLGGNFHTSPKGYTIDCGQWYGGFENRKGKVSAVAISNGHHIGDTSFIIY